MATGPPCHPNLRLPRAQLYSQLLFALDSDLQLPNLVDRTLILSTLWRQADEFDLAIKVRLGPAGLLNLCSQFVSIHYVLPPCFSTAVALEWASTKPSLNHNVEFWTGSLRAKCTQHQALPPLHWFFSSSVHPCWRVATLGTHIPSGSPLRHFESQSHLTSYPSFVMLRFSPENSISSPKDPPSTGDLSIFSHIVLLSLWWPLPPLRTRKGLHPASCRTPQLFSMFPFASKLTQPQPKN